MVAYKGKGKRHMDEIIKYFLKKINLSISLLLGVVFPGLYIFTFRNFELLEELDIIKVIIIACMITLPTYLIGYCLQIIFYTMIYLLFKKDANLTQISNNALSNATVINIVIVLMTWDKNFLLLETTLLLAVKTTIIFSISFAIVEVVIRVLSVIHKKIKTNRNKKSNQPSND